MNMGRYCREAKKILNKYSVATSHEESADMYIVTAEQAPHLLCSNCEITSTKRFNPI
jgi:hypothetical protein